MAYCKKDNKGSLKPAELSKPNVDVLDTSKNMDPLSDPTSLVTKHHSEYEAFIENYFQDLNAEEIDERIEWIAEVLQKVGFVNF